MQKSEASDFQRTGIMMVLYGIYVQFMLFHLFVRYHSLFCLSFKNIINTNIRIIIMMQKSGMLS